MSYRPLFAVVLLEVVLDLTGLAAEGGVVAVVVAEVVLLVWHGPSAAGLSSPTPDRSRLTILGPAAPVLGAVTLLTLGALGLLQGLVLALLVAEDLALLAGALFLLGVVGLPAGTFLVLLGGILFLRLLGDVLLARAEGRRLAVIPAALIALILGVSASPGGFLRAGRRDKLAYRT